MATANSEIQALIDSFATQLQMLTKRSALEQVLASLGGTAPAAKRGRGRPKGSKNKPTPTVKSATPAAAPMKILAVRKGKRRSAADVEQMGATLTSFVKANPGQRGEQIAKALRTDVGTIRLPMQAMIAAKKITTRGQRRGMTYYVAGAAPAGAPKAAKKAKRGRAKSKK